MRPATCDIVVSIYSAHRPTQTKGINEYGGFAGVSYAQSNCGATVTAHIQEPGWILDSEGPWQIGSPPCRKLVRIGLPDGVNCGPYSIANVDRDGLYSDYSARDGMGSAVHAMCAQSVKVDDDDIEAAIDAAIASGILLSVPQQDGTRELIQAEILDISPIYSHAAPEGWTDPTRQKVVRCFSVIDRRTGSAVCRYRISQEQRAKAVRDEDPEHRFITRGICGVKQLTKE
jgi:hypothetical protein